MLGVYALSKLGVSPTLSHEIDPQGIDGALYHALLTFAGSCEVLGPAKEVLAFLDEESWSRHALVLSGNPERVNYLIWDDQDSSRIVDDMQHLFDGRTASIIAIDLSVIGRRLMERGRKPIITIEAPVGVGVDRVRKLSN